MADNFKRFINTIPSSLNPEFNRVMNALIHGLAYSDDDVENQIDEGKKQLFVRTATGKNLEKLANSLGVAKPQSLGLTDVEFQELIPNLSLKPKAIRKSFYDTADVFWGPLYSRANISTLNFAPYNINTGDEIKVKIDNRPIQTVKVLPGDVLAGGAATAEELQIILSKINGATAEILEETSTSQQYLNIRTNTPGSTGSVQIYADSMIGSSKVDFPIGNYDILDLDQRVAVYHINNNELLIEIPAVIPALRRTLRGSHHFHEDATIEPARGSTHTVWAGSFLFSPNGQVNSFTVSRQSAKLQQTVERGNIYTSVAVDNNTSFENPSGQLIFDFGMNEQEGPVKYRGTPNSSTVLLDPGYVFRFDHSVNSSINVITETTPKVPRKSGKDLAVYLTSPSGAREVVQQILEGLAAAGVIIKFKILAPTYTYLIDNPYISDDDAPSVD